jgi:rhomboid-related protein 1/2/3
MILLNCFSVQIFLGIPLEIVHGPLRLSGVYLAGAVSGSLLTSITDSNTYLAGASGGVYALLLAHLPTIIMNWREMKTFVEWIVR